MTDAAPTTSGTSMAPPHAFHWNLPRQFRDSNHDSESSASTLVTHFAHHKARRIVALVKSIQLSETMFLDMDNNNEQINDTDDNGGDHDPMDTTDDSPDDDDKDINEAMMMLEEEDDDLDEEVKDVPTSAAASLSPEEEEHNHIVALPATLQVLVRKCSRLQSQITGLEALKYSGITTLELCEMVLHLLQLVTCTIEYQATIDADATQKVVTLYYENVGYIHNRPDGSDPIGRPGQPECSATCGTAEELNSELQRPFALPSPAREALLSVLTHMLSNKGPLRSVSNTAIYVKNIPESSTGLHSRFLMILHWKALLRTLLRTAPYLDERQCSNTVSDSSYRQSTVLKRTVQLIRDARHFFDQGIRPPTDDGRRPTDVVVDRTAREVWEMVQTDIQYHSHTHACYRGTILLYLFQPARCSPEYYGELLPTWLECWNNIDRCPEYDFLWLALFGRARKHVRSYDWGPIRRRLLTLSQYWLQLPIGGTSLDKTFPRTSNPRSRSCPARLKIFTGVGSSYEEGIDFVAKVVKLLVSSLGTGNPVQQQTEAGTQDPSAPTISEGTLDVLRFLSFATPYFNPSNLGSWTFTLGAFLHYFAYELNCRIGAAAGMDALASKYPGLVEAVNEVQPGSSSQDIPPHEVVALLDALLPLCQQAIYSKNGHVGRAGEAAMLYLVQIDPVLATPAFMDFATRALDVAAVNQSHQAPAALSTLTRLVQPSLRTDPSVLLLRLPNILSLSLAGIDSNDQNKCIRTLIFYRSLTSWVPVGGKPSTWSLLSTDEENNAENDGTMRIGSNLFGFVAAKRNWPEYVAAVNRLPGTSLLKQGRPKENISPEMHDLALEEAASAMSDWALEFLERVFGLLRASGEREKTGKNASGVATRHSNADVHQARNFSRVLTECLLQLFAAMDDEVHKLAVRSVVRFLDEETLPSASKDSALLCTAVAAARIPRGQESRSVTSPGLDALVPLLTDNFEHHSTKTVIYRIRCLAGAVRSAGSAVVKHREAISSAIDFALSSDDRHLFKTGCKLLRHTLRSLTECYPVSTTEAPRVYRAREDDSMPYIFGRSAQLRGDPVDWHVPDKHCIALSARLLNKHVTEKLNWLCSEDGVPNRSRLLHSVDIQELRRFLRVIRYSIRGGATILLDEEPTYQLDDCVPYELAASRVMGLVGEETKASLIRLRGRLSAFLIVLSSVIASDTLYPDAITSFPEDDTYRKTLPMICSDPKICKETCDLALLLLTRRGASFRSQEARTIWKAQTQLSGDFTMCAQVDRMSEVLQRASLYVKDTNVLYKDGENSGKTVPRRLLVARVKLFHDSLQRSASFEVPRRLRREERHIEAKRNILFSVKPSLPECVESLEVMLKGEAYRPLDAYEGIVDGLFALCCHSNTQVRGAAISVVDYAMTRFGWIVAPRVPRMLSGLSLSDGQMNGKFGLPSCELMADKLNHQGKRKRLAEAVKGVSSVLSTTRAIRYMLSSWKLRLRFVQTFSGTDALVSLMPAEEMQKIIHYLQQVFSPFRSSFYVQPRVTGSDRKYHESCLLHVLDILDEKNVNGEVDSESNEKRGAHWRKLLIASWFLLVLIDEEDITKKGSPIGSRTWSTCFRILENEVGQPLQRVSLGLFGKLLYLLNEDSDGSELREKVRTDAFCRVIGNALVYDHREDSSVGGGHDAQWSSGVENIIRDSSRLLAPRSLFPFQRTSQSLGSFKISHAQLVERLASWLDPESAMVMTKMLLSFSKELAASPPSEDQRNQQITSAEIFAGILGSFIRTSRLNKELWDELLLPHIDDVLGKIPFSLCGAYFDAVRYALQFSSAETFHPLVTWLIDKIKSTLWEPDGMKVDQTSDGISGPESEGGSQAAAIIGTEGFTTQSKWIYIFSAVIIELDENEADDAASRPAWYTRFLLSEDGFKSTFAIKPASGDIRERTWDVVSETLMPRLLAAVGHPFDSCRDHISRCMFRICYGHRKMSRTAHALSIKMDDRPDPGKDVVMKLISLKDDEALSFRDKHNAFSTARRFMSYCIHLGESKFEYSEYVIPLLPLAFEAMNSVSDEEVGGAEASAEDNAARRALEAETIKGYRYLISEVSVTPLIYGNPADLDRVLDIVETACKEEKWQVRHAAVNFVRCFQGAHKYLFQPRHSEKVTAIVTDLLADGRREVSNAAMAALTGILAALPDAEVARLVKKFAQIAATSRMKKRKKGSPLPPIADEANSAAEKDRSRRQQVSVFFLCATVMAQPYDTPEYVPKALAAISKHSFERSAPLTVRENVKKCCAEYKRTHVSDNWELHRSKFSEEQLEAFEEVVSTPHYYA